VQFTIVESAPAPKQKAVLFLPGIMGSHLYENDDTCFGFGEQRRWFSHTDCEQERLFLDENGNSLYDIYTKDADGGCGGWCLCCRRVSSREYVRRLYGGDVRS
jgi:hypothetical protein